MSEEKKDPKEVIKDKWLAAKGFEANANAMKMQILGIADALSIDADELNAIVGEDAFKKKQKEEEK